MFRVGDTILSEEIATRKFACDVSRCKGACCFVGDAGAPVSKEEIPALRKAYKMLEDELRPEAREAVRREGLIHKKPGKEAEYEINCVNDEACVFVQYDENGIAECAIQKAFYEKRLNWEKPISCHLYPVRLKRIAGMEYANFEYIPDLCSAACERGEDEGIYLSDFLEKALTRRYGQKWVQQFLLACREIRNG